MKSENSSASSIRYIHLMPLFRKIILISQYVLAMTVLVIGIMLWIGSMDFKNIATFLGLLSLFTGCIIFTSCSSPEINSMKKLFTVLGFAGLFASLGSALVLWQYLPVTSWYYFNLVIVIGICLSLFSETEQGTVFRSVIHVVASIMIIFTLVLMLLHIFGIADLKLPLLILLGATFLLLSVVLFKNSRKIKS
jgi:hypothetical protein